MTGDSSFWARRRAAVASEERAQLSAREAETMAAERAALEEKSDDEILADLDLPLPEAMNEGDDFSAFMSKAVPDRLRRRALRTLWRVNPVLANLDQLVDYGEDYTDSALVIENMQTAYQVGKGMLKHIQEMTRQAEEIDDPTEEPQAPDAEEEILSAETDAKFPEKATPLARTETFDVAPETDIAAPPRRMKFIMEERA